MNKLLIACCLFCLAEASFGQSNTFPTSGNVGIGTMAPRTTLDVNGISTFTSVVNLGGYSDIAMGAPVTISGGMLYNGGPTLNGTNSYWNATSAGQYLTIDLKSVVYFDAVSFGTYWKSDHHYIPSAYHISYSQDSLNWLNLITVVNNAETSVYHHFSRISCRYIRLTVDSLQNGMSSSYISSLRLLSTAYAVNFGNNPWSVLPGTDANNVVLATAGNVLVGKTSQTNSSYKLDVNGNVRANKLVVNTTGADYVFDSVYQLLPLDSLENYIQYHHHLPDIPSAGEMRQNGLDIAENQMKMLQKIEELTRYVVQLNKDLQKQREITEQLKTANLQLIQQDEKDK